MPRKTRVKEPERTLLAAYELFRSKKREEAIDLLLQAVVKSVSRNALDDAALFSSVRGSYFVAMGRDNEAHEAYLEAEQFAGGDAHYQLTTARHSVVGLGQAERALEVTAEILASDHGGAIRQEALAIRGIALLHLDQEKEAGALLSVMCSEFPQTALPALSRDLTLIGELAKRRLFPDLCKQYLFMVEGRARADDAKQVLDRISALRESIETCPGETG